MGIFRKSSASSLSTEEQAEPRLIQARQLLIGVAALYTFEKSKASIKAALPDSWELGFDVELTRIGSFKVEFPDRKYCIYKMPSEEELSARLKEDSDDVKLKNDSKDGKEVDYLPEVTSKLDILLKQYTHAATARDEYNAQMKKINNVDTPNPERAACINKIWEKYAEVTVEFSPQAAYAAVCTANILMPALLAVSKEPTFSMTVPKDLETVCGVLSKTMNDSAGLKNTASCEFIVYRKMKGTDTVNPAYNAIRDLWILKKQAEIDGIRADQKL